MTVGFSILAATDPYLAPAWAKAVLTAMVHNKWITPAASAPAALASAASSTPTAPAAWTVDSATHAFPGVSFAKYEDTIRKSFSLQPQTTTAAQEKNTNIQGIVDGYGIVSPAFVRDLKKMQTNSFIHTLERTPNWSAGAPVASYWDIFREEYPAISVSLMHNFQYMLRASTLVEQAFSSVENQVHRNCAPVTVQKNISFFQNVRSDVIQNLRKFKATAHSAAEDGEREEQEQHTKQHTRHLRNKDDLHVLAEHSLAVSKALQQRYYDAAPTNRELLGKRVAAATNGLQSVRAELESNKRPAHHLKGGSEIEKLALSHNEAAKTRSKQLPLDVRDQLTNIASKRLWNKEKVQTYLLCHTPHDEILIKQALLREARPPSTESLQTMLVNYWLSLEISPEDAEKIQPLQF